jgi:hypothetical protein
MRNFVPQTDQLCSKDCIGLADGVSRSNDQAIGNIFIGDPPPTPRRISRTRIRARVGSPQFPRIGRRITARTLFRMSPARCAAWFSNLDFFACFIDHQYYTIGSTIRYGRAGSWKFFAQQYTHPKIANLGSGLQRRSGGTRPAIPALQIDAGPALWFPRTKIRTRSRWC